MTEKSKSKSVAKKKTAKKKALKIVESDTQKMISVIDRAANNPDVDPEKMRQLLEVQITIMDRQAKIEFDAAMSECQSEMAGLRIIKTAENQQTHSSYAKHEIICAAIKPVYTKHGFRLSFSEGKAAVESEIRINLAITHKMGHFESFWIDLPADGTGIKGVVNKTAIHAKGSTLSYGRRYLTMMVFDLATFDDNDVQVDDGTPAAPPELPAYSDADFDKNISKWGDLIISGKKSASQVIASLMSRSTLTDKQKDTIRKYKKGA